MRIHRVTVIVCGSDFRTAYTFEKKKTDPHAWCLRLINAYTTCSKFGFSNPNAVLLALILE